MAWVESHQDLRDHPKTARFRRRLGVSLPTAIGHLHMLWWWALSYADDGELGRHDDDVIAEAGGWESESSVFVEALVYAGFLDEDRRIHDWDEYTGRLQERREANRLRQQRWREKKANQPHANESTASTNGLVTCDESVSNALNQPTNQPLTNQPDTPPPTPYPASGEGDAAGAAEKKRRRGRRNGVVHDKPEPPAEGDLTPVTSEDGRVWNLARPGLAALGLSPSNLEQIGQLVPIGRASDGGLHLRAPPGSGLKRYRNHVVRALLDAGDSAAAKAAIVEG